MAVVRVEQLDRDDPSQDLGSYQSSAQTIGLTPVDHPVLVRSIQHCIKIGWGNEQIHKVIGVPPEIIDRHRSLMKNKKK